MTDDDLARRVASAVQRHHLTIAVAESLTGGMLSSRLAAAPDAAAWFSGGVVAYSRTAKHVLLGVPEGPVVSRQSALAMATGVARILEADMSISVTGVGGPDPQDGQPPGTVWLAVYGERGARATEFHLNGLPEQILAGACERALEILLSELE